MSVTFSLPREFVQTPRMAEASCPSCRGKTSRDSDIDCESCMGYGGDTAAEDAYFKSLAELDGEFNVANGNATFILREVLNMPEAECYGSIDPSTVLMRVATFFDLSSGVVEPSQERAVILTEEGVSEGATVIDCGRSLDQVERYVASLKRLAEIAIERGAPVIQWG